MYKGEDVIPHAQLIVDGVFLGSEEAGSVPLEKLQRAGISLVVIPANTGCKAVHYPEHLKYLQYNVPDVPGFPLESLFGEFCSLIDSCVLSGGSVLVHCAQGKSRSATVVVAYAMWKYDLSAHDAIHLVNSRRLGGISSKFEAQLLAWEGRPQECPPEQRHRLIREPIFRNF